MTDWQKAAAAAYVVSLALVLSVDVVCIELGARLLASGNGIGGDLVLVPFLLLFLVLTQSLSTLTVVVVLVLASVSRRLFGVSAAWVILSAVLPVLVGLTAIHIAHLRVPHYEALRHAERQANPALAAEAYRERSRRLWARQLEAFQQRFEEPQHVVDVQDGILVLEDGLRVEVQGSLLKREFAAFAREHLIDEWVQLEVSSSEARRSRSGRRLKVSVFLDGELLNQRFAAPARRARHVQELSQHFQEPQIVVAAHGTCLHVEDGLCIRVWLADLEEEFEAFARDRLVGGPVQLEIPPGNAAHYTSGASCELVDPHDRLLDAFDIPYGVVPALVHFEGELLNASFARPEYRELISSVVHTGQ